MRWLLVMALIACSHHDNDGDHCPTDASRLCGADIPATCPATAPQQLGDCDVDSTTMCNYGDTTMCSCDGNHWLCRITTCPNGIPGAEPLACAATDTGCSYSDWEHDCDCGCVDTPQGRYWDCVGDTVGSICPKPPSQPVAP